MTPRDMRSRTRINICFSCNLYLPCLVDRASWLDAVFGILYHF